MNAFLLVVLIPVIVPLLNFVNEWLKPETQERIRTLLSQFEAQMKDSDPWNVIKAPLLLTSNFGDQIFGPRLISKRAFWWSARINLSLLVLSLIFTGIFTGKPFGLSPAPWEAYTTSISFCKEAVTMAKTNPKLKDDPNQEQSLKLLQDIISTMNHRWLERAYTERDSK